MALHTSLKMVDNEDRSWMDRALCTSADPEIFFPEKGQPGHEARAICARCPVIDECRDYRDATPAYLVSHGIWAGETGRELQRARRRSRRLKNLQEKGVYRDRETG